MRKCIQQGLLFFTFFVILFGSVQAQESIAEETAAIIPQSTVTSVKPDFLPPSEVAEFLGVRSVGGRNFMRWEMPDGFHQVEIRLNDAANILVLSGEVADVDHVVALIHKADVPPRQIEIEVKIIEVSTSKARDIGLDWEQALDRANPRLSYRYSKDKDDARRTSVANGWRVNSSTDKRQSIRSDLDFMSTIDLDDILSILDESGAARIHTAPHVLTLNNRRATILDGQRVTYVTRYAAYTNLFETDSLDAGLTLSVLPSLGESGYITLQINAELTTLSESISGSPVKDGQMIENTVIVKDGESVLLGGLSRTVERKSVKRFPILGHILPFLFSRDTKTNEEIKSYMILTTHVVDFNTALDEETKSIMEGE
ncbi:MAG: hypothetical protein KOO62_11900 [candidate division Zixibacteria bacterium]|nr:hypothetical protein [candidate division Zixibacteria bacterium]